MPMPQNVSMEDLNYKNVKLLQKYLTPAGSIVTRERSGLSAKMQRRLAREIKRARHLALLPFVSTLE